MCIATPMRVIALSPGHAVCEGRGEVRTVQTALVEPCAIGDWVLVFLGSARERIGADRAQEVNALLDLVERSMHPDVPAAAEPAFALPSQMSAEQLAALAGR